MGMPMKILCSVNVRSKHFVCAKYFCNKVQFRIKMPKISKSMKKESSSDSDSGPDDRNQPPPNKKAKETGKSNQNKDNDNAAGGGDGGATTWTGNMGLKTSFPNINHSYFLLRTKYS